MNARLTIAAMCLLSCIASVFAQDEVLMGSLGGIDMVAVLQESPGFGLLSTVIELRTIDPAAFIVTLTNLQISGGAQGLHQVWLDGIFGAPTPTIDDVRAGPTWAADWSPYDSHLLIGREMLVTENGAGFSGISETNDGASPVGAELTQIEGGFGANTGFGDIQMQSDTDAILLSRDFQSNTVTLAKIVGCHDLDDPLQITVGVLGAGIIDAGVSGGAAFGYDGNAPAVLNGPLGGLPISPQCVPEPSGATLGGFSMLALALLRRRLAA